MLKACIIFSALCLFAIGCYVMFNPDLSDLGFIPVVATNPETASEFRSLFAGSFIAYSYLLILLTHQIITMDKKPIIGFALNISNGGPSNFLKKFSFWSSESFTIVLLALL